MRETILANLGQAMEKSSLYIGDGDRSLKRPPPPDPKESKDKKAKKKKSGSNKEPKLNIKSLMANVNENDKNERFAGFQLTAGDRDWSDSDSDEGGVPGADRSLCFADDVMIAMANTLKNLPRVSHNENAKRTFINIAFHFGTRAFEYERSAISLLAYPPLLTAAIVVAVRFVLRILVCSLSD